MMDWKYAVVLAVGGSIAPGAANAQDQQFNLRCKGTTQTSSNEGETTGTYETLYRLDLAQNRWCENECRAIYKIASVQPSQITLQDDKEDGNSEQSYLSNFIIRTTGEHYIFSGMKMRSLGLIVTLRWEGHCEVEPFDGFPQIETKF